MTKTQFENIVAKCIREGAGIYDTKTYRYVLQSDGSLKRCRIENIGTTAALNKDAWETIREREV